MERTKFEFILKDLEQMFQPLSDWQREQYFEQLSKNPDDIFRKAIKRLIGDHKYGRTPLIGEIKEVIGDIIDEGSQAPIEAPQGCDKCNLTGIQLHPILHLGMEYMTAFPCECPKGQVYRRAWDSYKKRRRFIRLEIAEKPEMKAEQFEDEVPF